MKPPRISTRAEWDAAHGTGALDPGPEARVVIHHSYRPALPANATVAQEMSAIRGIERFHVLTNDWDGIGYNFLAAPSGRIYEGRGWKFRGSHAGPVNGDSIGVCLLIDGTVDEPNLAMVEAVRSLIAHGVELGEVAPGYTITGHRDHMARTCPGDKVYARLQDFRHDAEPEPIVELARSIEDRRQPIPHPGPVHPLRKPVPEIARPGETGEQLIARAGSVLGPLGRRLWNALLEAIMKRAEREVNEALGNP